MASITLTSADDGKSIEARVGDEIVVRLRENPTTGYRWQAELTGNLEQVNDSFTLDPNPQIGSGGIREFRFRLKASGRARLELKHGQAWDARSVDARFNLDIKCVQ